MSLKQLNLNPYQIFTKTKDLNFPNSFSLFTQHLIILTLIVFIRFLFKDYQFIVISRQFQYWNLIRFFTTDFLIAKIPILIYHLKAEDFKICWSYHQCLWIILDFIQQFIARNLNKVLTLIIFPKTTNYQTSILLTFIIIQLALIHIFLNFSFPLWFITLE